MPSFCLRINHSHHRNLILTCCPICYVPDTGICPAHPCPSVLTRHKANYVLYEPEKKTVKSSPKAHAWHTLYDMGKTQCGFEKHLNHQPKTGLPCPIHWYHPCTKNLERITGSKKDIYPLSEVDVHLLSYALACVLVVGLHKGPGWKLLVLQVLGLGT